MHNKSDLPLIKETAGRGKRSIPPSNTTAKLNITLLEYLEDLGRLTFQERSALEGYHQWLITLRKAIQAPTVSQWSYSVLKGQTPCKGLALENNEPEWLCQKTMAARVHLHRVFKAAPLELKQFRLQVDTLLLDHLDNIGAFTRLPPKQQDLLSTTLRKLACHILACSLEKVGKN
jgi:hypothetical protein